MIGKVTVIVGTMVHWQTKVILETNAVVDGVVCAVAGMVRRRYHQWG